MTQNAFEFMLAVDRPHAHAEVRKKILSLATEISALYKAHMLRGTGKTCDICGKGDSSEHHKVATVVHGYENREHESPVLCYNHRCGWALSFTALDARRGYVGGHRVHIPNEEVDLHFAQFVAKQLNKEARNYT